MTEQQTHLTTEQQLKRALAANKKLRARVERLEKLLDGVERERLEKAHFKRTTWWGRSNQW